MHTVEIRLTTPDRLDEALTLPADAIGMGQEGCLTKLPSTDTLCTVAERVRAAGRDFVLVAPIAWPTTADELLQRLLTVATDGPVTITVNDIGAAVALAAARPAGTVLIAGLGLTRARAHSANPDDSAPLAPAADTALLDLLHSHGVTGAELDTDTSVPAATAWQVRQYVDAVPAGFGRSCPTARHHRTGPPGCQPLCDTPYTISAHQRWQLNHGHREPVPAGTRSPALTVWGNAVYQQAHTAPTAGYRIIDARWHTPDALADVVTRLRGHEPVSAGR